MSQNFSDLPKELVCVILDEAFDNAETKKEWQCLFLVCKTWNEMMKDIFSKKKTRSVHHKFFDVNYDDYGDMGDYDCEDSEYQNVVDLRKDFRLNSSQINSIQVGDVVDIGGDRGSGNFYCFSYRKCIQHQGIFNIVPSKAYPLIRKFGIEYFKDIGNAEFFKIPSKYKIKQKLQDGTIVEMFSEGDFVFQSENMICDDERSTIFVYSRGEDSPDVFENASCIDLL